MLSKVPRRTLKCLPTPEPCGEHCSITSFLESALAEKLRLQSFVSFLLTFNSLNIHLASQSRAWESPPLPLTHPRDSPPHLRAGGSFAIPSWQEPQLLCPWLASSSWAPDRRVRSSSPGTGQVSLAPCLELGAKGARRGLQNSHCDVRKGEGDTDPGITRLLKGSSEVRGPSGRHNLRRRDGPAVGWVGGCHQSSWRSSLRCQQGPSSRGCSARPGAGGWWGRAGCWQPLDSS